MDKNEFISSIKIGALKGMRDYGILPSLTMAQAILESGWGSSELSKKANNLFGIKAFSDWIGGRVDFPTKEWCDNEMVIVTQSFRSYNSFNDSIEDHSKLLSCVRYNSVRQSVNYKEACQAVYDSGYATDPEYSAKLINLIEENRLYEFDGIQDSTETAVSEKCWKTLKFQQLCNVLNITDSYGKQLKEDNILGERTRSCIPKMPMLFIGSHGPAVEFVQEVVMGVGNDGNFGPITRQSVIEYQKAKGITADGIVGRQTWNVIVNT